MKSLQLSSSFLEQVSSSDEQLFLQTALTARRELWQNREVLDVIRTQHFANDNVRLVLELLTCSSLTAEARGGLKRLLERENAHLLWANLLAHFLTDLHLRGIVDAPPLLLPKLKWHSSIRLWENAVEVLSICAPHVLKDTRLRRLASLRSKRCRWLLQFFAREVATGRPAKPYDALRKAAVALSRFGDIMHSDAVCDLVRICLHREPDLACDLARELVVLRDFRDLELLIHFLYQSRDASNLETLASIAKGPNPKAARLAKSLLEKPREPSGWPVFS